MNWYLEVLKKYVVFTGRARRKEYWMFALFQIIIFVILSIIDSTLGLTIGEGMGILYSIYALATLLPSLGVSVRRLHDTGRSAWWLLISFIPLLGALVLLVFMVLDSQPGDNEYGPNPKEVY